MRRSIRFIILVMFLSASPVPAQTIDRHGAPSVACDADGGFVVVWQSRGQDGDGDLGAVALKCYTGNGAWWFDDEGIAYPMLEEAYRLGLRTINVHKCDRA